MEYCQTFMINITQFAYKPGEHETESASHSYIMSLIAIMAGVPLPIMNLIATLIFYLALAFTAK